MRILSLSKFSLTPSSLFVNVYEGTKKSSLHYNAKPKETFRLKGFHTKPPQEVSKIKTPLSNFSRDAAKGSTFIVIAIPSFSQIIAINLLIFLISHKYLNYKKWSQIPKNIQISTILLTKEYIKFLNLTFE